MKLNILFTSVGRRGYLVKYFKDEIGEKGVVHAANSDDEATGLLYADRRIKSPLIYDDDYIPFLIQYCIEHQIDAIIPLFDIDLGKLSENRKDFANIGVSVVVSNENVVEICNDKWALQNFLKKRGYHFLPAYLELDKAVEHIQEIETDSRFFIKPRFGMGSIANYKVENSDEMSMFYTYCKKQISESYLKYSSKGHEHSVLIQKFIKGTEYNLDVINDLKGNYQTTVVKKKLRMRCGETDAAEIVNIAQLEDLGRRISGDLEHIGNLDVDLLMHDDQPYVIDMNARFGGGYPFSHLGGVNLPLAMLYWLDNETPPDNLFKVQFGTKGAKGINILKV
ncbi:MAG: ATP-grasp domain-containing protein [Balneolaceae bacterium]|nr:ATP-grasp domain-containing protein [Balneolaceae bacterium]